MADIIDFPPNRSDTSEVFAVCAEHVGRARSGHLTNAPEHMFAYEEAQYDALTKLPPSRILPFEVIGYWVTSSVVNHGPILRFWSFTESSKLISFVSWHALVQRPADIFHALKARGAPMSRIGASASAHVSLSDWIQQLQAQSLDARILANFEQVLLTPLPGAIRPPELIATLRQEWTGDAWLTARSTVDIHEQFIASEQHEAAGGFVH